MSGFLKKLKDESGQAVVEYVLILIVVVGIILGGLYQLNTAFRSWSEKYFGDYLSCLLETGELPSLGGAGISQGECEQQFEQFSLANGRPLVGGGVGAGGAAGDAGAGDDSMGDEGGSAGAMGAGGGDGGAVVVQRFGADDPFGSSGGSRRFRARAAPSGDDEGSKSSTGTAAITDLGGSGQDGKAIRIPVKNSVGLLGGRRYESEDEKTKDKTLIVAQAGGVQDKKGPELMRIERQPTEAKAPEIEEFTFGKFLRYLLIAAIVIAIVIFIGGQVLQVSKSMD